MTSVLRFISRSIVRLPEVFGFVTVTRFDGAPGNTEAEVLASLIATPEFVGPGYDAVPRTAAEDAAVRDFRDRWIARARANPNIQLKFVDREPFHGPLPLSELDVAGYQLTNLAAAQDCLAEWATEYEEPPAEFLASLADQVYPALDAPSLYRLAKQPDRANAPNPYGLWLYREFVAIDATSGHLALVIAAYN